MIYRIHGGTNLQWCVWTPLTNMLRDKCLQWYIEYMVWQTYNDVCEHWGPTCLEINAYNNIFNIWLDKLIIMCVYTTNHHVPRQMLIMIYWIYGETSLQWGVWTLLTNMFRDKMLTMIYWMYGETRFPLINS